MSTVSSLPSRWVGKRVVQGVHSATQWYTVKRAVCVECAIFGGLSKCIQAEWAAVSFRGGTFPAKRKETSVWSVSQKEASCSSHLSLNWPLGCPQYSKVFFEPPPFLASGAANINLQPTCRGHNILFWEPKQFAKLPMPNLLLLMLNLLLSF